MKEIKGRSLAGWSEVVLGTATVCLNPDRGNRNYHRKHEGPLPVCNKCGNRIKYAENREEHG